jgi:outer membrane murein-binding lipoprotein Lpp
MPLEGLRAWIGEVERKLRARTRVMLALAAIAIGGAGAAVYLAVDAHNTAVSESDVQALQSRLEARIDQVSSGASSGAPAVTKLESEVKALKAEVEALKGGTAKPGAAKEGPATGAPGTTGSGTNGSRAQPPSSTTPTGK